MKKLEDVTHLGSDVISWSDGVAEVTDWEDAWEETRQEAEIDHKGEHAQRGSVEERMVSRLHDKAARCIPPSRVQETPDGTPVTAVEREVLGTSRSGCLCHRPGRLEDYDIMYITTTVKQPITISCCTEA